MSDSQQVPQPVFSVEYGSDLFDENDLMLFSDIFDDDLPPSKKSNLRDDDDDDDGDSDDEGVKKRKTAGVPIALLTKEEQLEKRFIVN